MRTYLLIALLMPLLAVSQSKEKTLSYDMLHKGKVIGTLDATQKINGDTETYVVTTNITKKVMHVKHCTYDLVFSYKNGELQNSDYKLYINDKLDKTITSEQGPNGLKVYKNNKEKKAKRNHVYYSSGLLYFKEPTGVKETFSETNLKVRSLEAHKSKAHTYVLDKNAGEYYYENGELQHMVYDDMVTIELVRKNR